VPEAQFVHAEDEAAEYDPSAHFEHDIAEDSENEPEEQIPVIAERPAVAQYDPKGHPVQMLEPEDT